MSCLWTTHEWLTHDTSLNSVFDYSLLGTEAPRGSDHVCIYLFISYTIWSPYLFHFTTFLISYEFSTCSWKRSFYEKKEQKKKKKVPIKGAPPLQKLIVPSWRVNTRQNHQPHTVFHCWHSSFTDRQMSLRWRSLDRTLTL